MTQWEVAHENDANDYFAEWLAIMAGTETVAQTPSRCKITDEDRTNAPILAAAPELLAACRAAAGYLETVEQFGCSERRLMEQLEQALARARPDEHDHDDDWAEDAGPRHWLMGPDD